MERYDAAVSRGHRESEQITIKVRQDLFTFISAKNKLEVRTFVCIEELGMTVVSYGEEATDTPCGLRFSLFDEAPPIPGGDRYKFLEEYVISGVIRVRSRFFFQPKLIFRNIHAVHSIFRGYEKGLFNQIASRVAARVWRHKSIESYKKMARWLLRTDSLDPLKATEVSPYLLLDPLKRWLSQEIVIEVSPDLFTFISADKMFELPTYVYLTTDQRDTAIVSIGEEAPGKTDAFRAALFAKESPFPEDDRCEWLETFIKYGLLQIISQYTIFAPTVVFRSIDAFESIFHGYEKCIFNLIASRVGIEGITFGQTPGRGPYSNVVRDNEALRIAISRSPKLDVDGTLYTFGVRGGAIFIWGFIFILLWPEHLLPRSLCLTVPLFPWIFSERFRTVSRQWYVRKKLLATLLGSLFIWLFLTLFLSIIDWLGLT